jgi:hypothetical protein
MRTVTPGIGLAAGCLLAVTCASEADDGGSLDRAAPEHIDSAGTTIISQDGPDRALDWHGEEVLRLGPADEGPDAFFRIRSDGSGLGADTAGNIYVVDTGHYEVRVFDREGRHLRSLGRRGEGPGEFVIPHRLFVSPDGIVAVADNSKRALVRFAPDGTEMPAVRLPLNAPSGHAAGGLVATGSEPYQSMEEALERAPRRVRLMHVPLDIWGGSGAAGDSVRELGSWVREQDPSVRIPGCDRRVSFPRPLRPSHPLAAAGERIAWVGGPEYVVNVVGPGGGRASVRRALPAVEATPELAARDFGSTSIELASHEMCEITGEMAVRAAGHGPVVPWITDLRVAPDGGLFVERRDPADLPTRRIDVFHPDGAYAGTLPAAFPLPDVFHGPDTFLRLERDSLNVQSVVLYRIVRGPAAQNR